MPEDLMGRVTIIYLLFDAGSASNGALLDGPIAGAAVSRRSSGWLAVISIAAWVAALWRALDDRAIERAHAVANIR